MKAVKYIILLIIGFLLGLAFYQLKPYIFRKPSVLLEAEKDFKSNEGIFIPKGTQLSYQGAMPEGYLKASLNIAIEGKAIENFKKIEEERTNLVVQYFIHEPYNIAGEPDGEKLGGLR